jgi:hypothetical protein
MSRKNLLTTSSHTTLNASSDDENTKNQQQMKSLGLVSVYSPLPPRDSPGASPTVTETRRSPSPAALLERHTQPASHCPAP